MSNSTNRPRPPPSPTSFRFDEQVKSALKTIAERESRSVANTIEWLAKDYFKQRNLDWPNAKEELNQDMEKPE